MIPALSRFALLIINALQPAASMERNRLTGTCEKTGTGPQGASHCPGGACLKVPVELRALLLGTTLAVLPQRRQEDLSLGYPPMSNISVGARDSSGLRRGLHIIYSSIYSLKNMCLFQALDTVINKTDRISVLSEFHFSLRSRQ